MADAFTDCGPTPHDPLSNHHGAPRFSGALVLRTLYARKTLDSALLRLSDDPPEGAVFARWSTDLADIGTALVSVHYPHGQGAKVARGQLCRYWNCADVAYCGEEADPEGLHYLGVSWAEGLTSGGSSGAGAFRADTGELVGVLSDGLSEVRVSLLERMILGGLIGLIGRGCGGGWGRRRMRTGVPFLSRLAWFS